MDTLKIFIGTLVDSLTQNAGACVASMFSAFFGATCAMSFQRWKEKQKRIEDEHGAIVRCQMVLVGQLNTISNLKEQYLDPLRNDPNREKKLINFRMSDAGLRVAYDSLSFLLTTENPTLLMDVHSAEQSYISAMECLQWKNEAYEKIHGNSTLERIDPTTGACAAILKDPRYLLQLKFLTDALYKSVDNAEARLDLQIKELQKAGKLLHPKKKFLQIAGRKADPPTQSPPAKSA